MPHIGSPVYAVMQDGACHCGILCGVADGHLYLNTMPGALSLASIKARPRRPHPERVAQAIRTARAANGSRSVKALISRTSKLPKVRTKAWGFGPYGGWGWGWGWGFGAAAFGLAALAALFLIPFFWI